VAGRVRVFRTPYYSDLTRPNGASCVIAAFYTRLNVIKEQQNRDTLQLVDASGLQIAPANQMYTRCVPKIRWEADHGQT